MDENTAGRSYYTKGFDPYALFENMKSSGNVMIDQLRTDIIKRAFRMYSKGELITDAEKIKYQSELLFSMLIQERATNNENSDTEIEDMFGKWVDLQYEEIIGFDVDHNGALLEIKADIYNCDLLEEEIKELRISAVNSVLSCRNMTNDDALALVKTTSKRSKALVNQEIRV